MLAFLHIRNYALIQELEMEFFPGFSIITGETGAGKSILLGALSLLLGNRADSSVLNKGDKKCIVEGGFNIKAYKIRDFFSENEIDYEEQTLIRREIAPGGKSRAFINDTPVPLNLLKELGLKLVDIHSQHHNLHLAEHAFQLKVVDTVARNQEIRERFSLMFTGYKEVKRKHQELLEKSRKQKTDLDYFIFQFEQLDQAKLKTGELEELEEEFGILEHTDEIKLSLEKLSHLLSGEGNSVLEMLKESSVAMSKLINFFPPAGELAERLNSCLIELKDLAGEAESRNEDIETDPSRREFVRERLDLYYNLIQKHGVMDVNGLISLREELDTKIRDISSFDEQISSLGAEMQGMKTELDKLAAALSSSRLKVLPEIEKKIVGMLVSLGIPNARFGVRHQKMEEFGEKGSDQVEFLFSANKQTDLQEISRVASGGEMSRLMLSIKSLLTDSLELPTIIFDEVDSGVSGDIADKVGGIMRSMSRNKQVINITHLPQVAGKGDIHYLVYKSDRDGATYTGIRKLNSEERILEIAKMLSGEELTDAAISNAKELLN